MHKIFTALTILALSYSSAYAEISPEVVESAWKRIAGADGFQPVPINYEDKDAPNAWVKFKSQNNYSVHVTKGLMKILNTEEQIAGVLGHEIGHVRLGHYSSNVGRSVGWAVLGTLLGRIGGVGGVAAQTAGQVGANLAESGFSRGQEVEADDYGTELLKKAGYDPYGLYYAMKAFADNKFVTQPDGFNSHPPTERRLQHLYEKAKEVKARKEVKTSKTSGTKPKKKKSTPPKQSEFMK